MAEPSTETIAFLFTDVEGSTRLLERFPGPMDLALALHHALLDQAITDGVSDIVIGRAQLSALDGLVKDWRTNGGDKSRAEYQDALAAAK